MTTNAHDSGVETSNDSNDTAAAAANANGAPPAAAQQHQQQHQQQHHAFSFPTGPAVSSSSLPLSSSSSSVAAGLSFPMGVEQRSQTQFTTRNALMLYGDGGTGGTVGSRLFFVRPTSSSSNSNSSSSSTSQTTTTQSSQYTTRTSSTDSGSGGGNANDMDTCTTSTSTTAAKFRPFHDCGAGQQQQCQNGTGSISEVSAQLAERSSKTLIDTCNVVTSMLRSQMSASIASVVQQQPAASASPSAMLSTTSTASTSCPPSPHSNPHGRFELRVPLAFLSSFQPTYPNDSSQGASGSSSSLSAIGSSHSATSDLHQLNRLKAVRGSGSGSSAGGPASLLHHPHRHHQVPYIICVSNERKLRLAASLSNVEVLLRLLDAGVNPNSVDEYKRSALHLAASRGYTDVVIQLLKYGARTGAQDSLGNTPLHLAVCSASSFNFNRVVRILLRHGASVQVQDNHGKTPLDLVKSKLSMMRLRRANDHSPEAIKMLFDLSVLTALLISTCMRELKSADDINSLEQRLQQLSTSEVECEADALLAKVEQLTLKN